MTAKTDKICNRSSRKCISAHGCEGCDGLCAKVISPQMRHQYRGDSVTNGSNTDLKTGMSSILWPPMRSWDCMEVMRASSRRFSSFSTINSRLRTSRAVMAASLSASARRFCSSTWSQPHIPSAAAQPCESSGQGPNSRAAHQTWAGTLGLIWGPSGWQPACLAVPTFFGL